MERRVLCVYQHAPTPAAPGIYRHRTLLAELVRRGWKVDLVSSPINYMRGVSPPEYRGSAYKRETIEGIVHHWVWALANVHSSKSSRALNYLTFMTSSAICGAFRQRPDVIWVSSPPLTVGIVGAFLAKRFRRPWVFEVRDLWPESAAAVGWLRKESRIYKALDRLARHHSRRANAVITPSSGLVAPLMEHGASRVTWIPGTIEHRAGSYVAAEEVRNRLGVNKDTCIFAYVGAVGVANGLDTLIEAVARIPIEIDYAVVIVGDGSAKASLEQTLERRPNRRVHLFPAVSKEEAWNFLAAADVCIHTLRPDPLFETATPTKLLEYMSASKAFITTVPGVSRELAVGSGGTFARTVQELAFEMTRWTRMPPDERRSKGEQSFHFGREHFSLQTIVDRLESLLVECMTT